MDNRAKKGPQKQLPATVLKLGANVGAKGLLREMTLTKYEKKNAYYVSFLFDVEKELGQLTGVFIEGMTSLEVATRLRLITESIEGGKA